MLEELIREIQSGRTVQPAELASRLHTTPVMVQMMLEYLERMGKLAPLQTDCAAFCGECAAANMCLPKGRGKARIWRVNQ